MNRFAICLCFITVLLIACGRKNDKASTSATLQNPAGMVLPMPVVPPQIQDSREKLRYVLTHYWDAMNWRDTALVNNEEFMEQSMVDYFAILAKADSLVGSDGVNRMIASASVNPSALAKVVEISSRYLYEPESPMYDAEGYAMLLDQLILDPTNAGIPRETLEARHAQIMKNRMGRKAADDAPRGCGRDGGDDSHVL